MDLKFNIVDIKGLEFNPFSSKWKKSDNISVNYIICSSKISYFFPPMEYLANQFPRLRVLLSPRGHCAIYSFFTISIVIDISNFY